MTGIVRTALLLDMLRRGARRPGPALRELQGRLLRAAVTYAHRQVPFYRRVWDAAGLDPASIRSIDDLARLPIIDGALVRAAVASGELVSRAVDVTTCPGFSTSGTSGRPLRVPRGPVEARLWRAAGLRTLLEHGFRGGQRTVQFDAPATGVHPLQRLGLARTTWIPVTLPPDEQLARLIAARADVVIGMPTVLRRCGRAIVERGLKLPRPPRLVVCQGEILDSGSRRAIRHAFGTDPVDVYGLTEVGYVAWQCEERGALHVNADLVAVEIVGDEAAAAPGELGRVVITDLRGRTMPLLRYDTGDLARAFAEPCPCGRTLPALNPIEGRQSRTVTTGRGQRVTTRAIVEALAGILVPDDFRLTPEAGAGFRLQVTPEAAAVADGADLRRAVLRLRALLDAADLRVEIATWSRDGPKTEVVTRP